MTENTSTSGNEYDPLAMMDVFQENISNLVGYRTLLLAEGFSETAAEQMTANMQIALLSMTVESFKAILNNG